MTWVESGTGAEDRAGDGASTPASANATAPATIYCAWLTRAATDLTAIAIAAEPTRHDQRRRLLRALDVTLVVDGGANVGQYAGEHLRLRSGYGGRVVSFEPVPLTAAALRERAAGDALWEVREAALSDAAGQATIVVPGDSSDLASLRPLTGDGAALVNGDAERRTSRTPYEVATVRLDEAGVVGPEDRVLLKLDLQGHEPEALAGSEGILDRVVAVECELSLVAIYEGQRPYGELLAWFADRGLEPVGFHNNWLRQDGRAIDVDVFLARSPMRGG